MIEEEKKALPDLRLFFERLIAIKNKIKFYERGPERDQLVREIYDELDGIIKEAQK